MFEKCQTFSFNLADDNLEIMSWCRIVEYDFLCGILGIGVISNIKIHELCHKLNGKC